MLNIMEAATLQKYKALRAAEDTANDYMYVNEFNNSLLFSNNGDIKVLAPPTMEDDQTMYIDYGTSVEIAQRDGTQAKPFASWEEALEFIPHDKNGHVLTVSIGVFDSAGNPPQIDLSNQKDMKIIFRNATGTSPNPDWIEFSLKDCENIEFDNFMGTVTKLEDCNDIVFNVDSTVDYAMWITSEIKNCDKVVINGKYRTSKVSNSANVLKLVNSFVDAGNSSSLLAAAYGGSLPLDIELENSTAIVRTSNAVRNVTLTRSHFDLFVANECDSITANNDSLCSVFFTENTVNVGMLEITSYLNSNVTVAGRANIALKSATVSHGGFIYLDTVTKYIDGNNDAQDPSMTATMSGTIVYAETGNANGEPTVTETKNTAGRIIHDSNASGNANSSATANPTVQYFEDTDSSGSGSDSGNSGSDSGSGENQEP